ncbi:MAG TPA: hypothetical protein VFV79_02425 [Saprospiraceae bacterium]|nr:hypothetical protein [Saprospiraceae bacterium]
MIKIGLLSCLMLTIIFLGLKLPYPPPGHYRDPVPQSQKVAHSSHCSGCHGYDDTKMALVDAAGNDVNIYDDWQISMMGLSAHDPFWRATLAHEVNLFPTAKDAIETTCLKCHAPLGSFQAHLRGMDYSYENMLSDTLGLDGVSCSACHQQPMQNLGKGHSGNFTMDTNRIFFGHYPNPFKGPMQIYVGFEPEFSDHIYDSGLCSGCHTLITETLDEAGTPTGNYFVEQATYHEWLNSVYPAQGKECQTCHLPFIADGVVIATDFLALEPRQPFGLHQFFGANTAMLSLMQEYKDTLNLPEGSSENAWTESINNNRMSLRQAADIRINPVEIVNDTLIAHISIKNQTGHKFPSGYPSRIAWLQVILVDHDASDTIYANGLMDANGHIIGRDLPAEPHHEIARSQGDVQIYELAMRDVHGNLTTRLNAAYEPLKDNRILPYGFSKSHAVYDTVAIWGNALSDINYDSESNKGQDDIEYRIPLNGRMGFGDLYASLHYQTLPPRWVEDIFTNDTIPQVGLFKNMYGDYATFDELIDSFSIREIDLNTVASHNADSDAAFSLTPNPVNGNFLYLDYPNDFNNQPLYYRLMDITGKLIQQGPLSKQIQLQENIPAAVYYFLVYDRNQVRWIRRLVVL